MRKYERKVAVNEVKRKSGKAQGSSHVLTMDTQGGWKEKAGWRRLAEPSAKSQALRASSVLPPTHGTA
jgi:hypothetical protein